MRLVAPLGMTFVFLGALTQYTVVLLTKTSGPISPLQHGLAQFFGVGLWLSAALSVHRLLNWFFWDGLVGRALGGQCPRLFKDLSGTFIFFVALTGIVAEVFGRPVTGLWAASSALAVVVGVALRSVILDVFIGVAINLEQPYKLGDWIQLHHGTPDEDRDVHGKVVEIDWRTTRIRTRDDRVVILPNSMIGTSMITNWMEPDDRNRSSVSLYLDPWLDPDRAAEILVAGATAAVGPGGILAEPAPMARARGVGAEGARYDLYYWWDVTTSSPVDVRDELVRNVLRGLRASGITPSAFRGTWYTPQDPVPQLDPRHPEDRARLLGQVEIFASLEAGEIVQLAESVRVLRLEPGQVLLRAGEAGDTMYVVVEGLLDVEIRMEDLTMKRVGVVGPGRYIGELSLLTGSLRTATLTVRRPSVLYEIQREALVPLFEARPGLVEDLARSIAATQLDDDQAREAHAREIESKEDHEERVAGLLETIRGVFSGITGIFGA